MRRVGAVEAYWHDNGTVGSLKLGPVPIDAMRDREPRKSAEVVQYEKQREKERISLGAVARLSAREYSGS